MELDPGDGADVLHRAIAGVKAALGPEGAQVTAYPPGDDAGRRLFLTQDARATDALLGEHRNAQTGWIVDTTAKSLRSEGFNAHTAETIGELPEVVRKARRVETYDSGPGDDNDAVPHVFATLDVREEKGGGRRPARRIEAVDVRKAGGTNAGPEGFSGSAPVARTNTLRDFLGDHRFSDGSPAVPPDGEPPEGFPNDPTDSEARRIPGTSTAAEATVSRTSETLPGADGNGTPGHTLEQRDEPPESGPYRIDDARLGEPADPIQITRRTFPPQSRTAMRDCGGPPHGRRRRWSSATTRTRTRGGRST